MNLRYIKSKYTLTDPVVYQLAEIRPERRVHTRFFTISKSGLLFVMPGYSWDGPSGPTVDTLDTMFASLVHDVLYEAFRKHLLAHHWREAADRELSAIGKACGASENRMKLWEWAVGMFAAGSARPTSKRVIYEAPAVTSLKEVVV